MVGRHVEQAGHVRVELMGAGELEARELGDEPLPSWALATAVVMMVPMLPTAEALRAARAQELRGERRRGRLAVGAGDGDPALGALAPGELGLADDLGGEQAAAAATKAECSGMPGEATARS